MVASSSIYYISFNKQPVRNGKAGETVEFSVVIQNDLREVVYQPESPLRLQMAWLEASGADTYGGTLHPCKAGYMHWASTAQAHKLVELKCTAFRGKRMRLAVYVDDSEQRQPWIYDLGGHAQRTATEKVIFVPILSPVITFDRSPDAGVEEDLYPARMFSLDTRGAPILIREQGGFSLEGHLWDAALHLTSWLGREGVEIIQTSKRILELGSGTGLVSISTASILQKNKSYDASVYATDLLDAMDLLDVNATGNRMITVTNKVLDWEQSEHSSLLKSARPIDLVLVADCTYNPSFFDALSRTIAIALSKSAHSRCILSKKHRHIDEDALWPALDAARLTYELVAGTDAALDADSLYAYTGWGIYSIRTANVSP